MNTFVLVSWHWLTTDKNNFPFCLHDFFGSRFGCQGNSQVRNILNSKSCLRVLESIIPGSTEINICLTSSERIEIDFEKCNLVFMQDFSSWLPMYLVKNLSTVKNII